MQDENVSLESQKDDEYWFRKDANEVLMKDGPDILRKYVENAWHVPVVGLTR